MVFNTNSCIFILQISSQYPTWATHLQQILFNLPQHTSKQILQIPLQTLSFYNQFMKNIILLLLLLQLSFLTLGSISFPPQGFRTITVPKPKRSITKDDFILPHGIIYGPVPLTFIHGEIYQFQGSINGSLLEGYKLQQKWIFSRNLSSYRVSLGFFRPGSNTHEYVCHDLLPIDEIQFYLQCKIPALQEFKIGLFLDESGSLLDNKTFVGLKTSEKIVSFREKPDQPENVKIYIENNELYFSWEKKATLTKIIFSQRPETKKTFLLSNSLSVFKIPYHQFQDFQEGKTGVEIRHAESENTGASDQVSQFSEPFTTSIKATRHHFVDIQEDIISLNSALPSSARVNENVEISGTYQEEIQNKAIVVQPNGQIKSFELEINQRVKGFKFLYSPKTEGTHIIQINHETGFAVLNSPLYVGEIFPLLPDFQDYQNQQHFSEPQTIEEQRQLLLELINEKRLSLGVHPLQIDDQLNKLAQRHSDDMVKNNFDGHENLEGERVQQRAQKIGFRTILGENIVIGEDIVGSQKKLNRSPGHIRTTVDQNWQFIGIGIRVGENGYYYITQDFSTRDLTKYPLTKSDIQDHKVELLEALTEKNDHPFMENRNLSRILSYYIGLNRLSPSLLDLILKTAEISKKKIVDLRIPIYGKNFVEEIKEQGYLSGQGMNRVGMVLKGVENSLRIYLLMH